MLNRDAGSTQNNGEAVATAEGFCLTEERSRAIFEQANVGIAQVGIDARFLDVNDRFCEILGYSRAELLARAVPDVSVEPEIAQNLALMQQALRGDFDRYELEKHYRRKNGSLVWASVRARVVRSAGGVPLYFIAVIEDISTRKTAEKLLQNAHDELERRVAERTAQLREANATLLLENAERREAEAGLAEHRELLRCVLDSLPAQIAVLDRAGIVVAVNRVWERFGAENGGVMRSSIGMDYLETCRRASESGEVDALEAMSGIQCVLSGSLADFLFDYSCPCGAVERRFRLCAAPLSREKGGAVITHVEITDSYRAQRALRESHALLRDVIEGTTDAVYVKDLQGRYTMMNSAGAANLGHTPEDVIGKTARDLFDPDLSRRIVGQDLAIVASGLTRTFNITMRMLGRDRDFLAMKGVCRDVRGDIIGIFGISRDITDLNRAHADLAHERNRLRTLIDNVPDLIFVKDLESRFVLSNAAHLHLLGEQEGVEIYGKTDFDFFPEEIASRYYNDERTVISSGQPLIDRVETTLDAAGGTRWLLTTKVPLRDATGQVIGLVGIGHDITDRRRKEVELARFASIVATSNDAIISANSEGCILSWNAAAERIFGYTEQEIVGQRVLKLSPPDRHDESRKMIAAVRAGGSIQNRESVRITKDGRLIDIAVTISPICAEDGSFLGTSAIVRDITERKRLEREILEISDLEKRRIGQDLHDDLCQYLVGIALLANVLHDNLARQELPEAGDARQINELVRQAVAKTRIIAKGLAPLELAGAGLMGALNELSHNVKRLFGIDCLFECDTPVEIADSTVSTHLFRIAQEATHNAAKHCQGDRIAIGLSRTPVAIILTVEDNGVGCCIGGPPPTGGLGLHTMQYRARVIGASLEFARSPLGGTAVRCMLLRPADRADGGENVR